MVLTHCQMLMGHVIPPRLPDLETDSASSPSACGAICGNILVGNPECMRLGSRQR